MKLSIGIFSKLPESDELKGLARCRGKVDCVEAGNQADLARHAAYQAAKHGIKQGIVTPVISARMWTSPSSVPTTSSRPPTRLA
ncbi:hypothetical protein [Streptomyces spongiae]|uniref:Uncharacterized protein n=1 Tax=Streptomyces spongiae TaxID=565072 RepID=A0A5N8XPJ8_9ACTN|nr:hypothetical protein [Streptomyces spongiae]MPY61413.1 hypothetical protein [Streptomyces spongiae]